MTTTRYTYTVEDEGRAYEREIALARYTNPRTIPAGLASAYLDSAKVRPAGWETRLRSNQYASAQALDAADRAIEGRYYGTSVAYGGINSAEREARIARLQRQREEAADRIERIQYPDMGPRTVRGVTIPEVSPYLLESTAASRAKAAARRDRPASARRSGSASRSGYGYSRSSRSGYKSARSSSRSAREAAMALDAADGVIDGKYYGRDIVISDTYDSHSSRHRATRDAALRAEAEEVERYRSRAALDDAVLSLDAADGVIDGKYYGREIRARSDLSRSAEDEYLAGYNSRRSKNRRSSAAAALDAADGVMDGRFFGRDIIEEGDLPRRHKYRSSAAAALDAADGVMDGKYYGRDILDEADYDYGYFDRDYGYYGDRSYYSAYRPGLSYSYSERELEAAEKEEAEQEQEEADEERATTGSASARGRSSTGPVRSTRAHRLRSQHVLSKDWENDAPSSP